MDIIITCHNIAILLCSTGDKGLLVSRCFLCLFCHHSMHDRLIEQTRFSLNPFYDENL